ncbi:MAG TPA: UDP-glucose/GDP-mannose dehydrogenase family protein [Ramlibacter sp.]|nr:UDP-glucose/GDP-mannose dehydrogenase family protein [Ramlibacter sp.]
MKVTVIGTGYVGLVTGACLADVGNDVLCFDIDAGKLAALERGEVHIYEPGLQDVVRRNVKAGRLRFTSDARAATAFGVFQFIAVGTPPGEDGSADLQYVLAGARAIGRHMSEYKVVIDKSTVPVGTARRVRDVIAAELEARGMEVPFSVVSNPEFLKEGAAVSDFMRPDRIIVGSDDDKATALMREVYAPFQRHHERFLVMSIESAELTKYAANAMLATRISFMNEMANLAERLGADIESVRKGIGSDPRIGYDFLYAGCGYGGSCFPKDLQALVRTAEQEAGLELNVLSAVEVANGRQKQVLPGKIRKRFGERLDGRRFALWGLAFKANTDDMREAPSRAIIESLLAAGASVTAYDPVAMESARRAMGAAQRLDYAPDAMSAVKGADALVIATEWKEFRSPDFDAIAAALREPIIFDGRNLYDPAALRARGFEYHAIGR